MGFFVIWIKGSILWPCMPAQGLRRGFAKSLLVMPSEPPQMGEAQATGHFGHGEACAASQPLARLIQTQGAQEFQGGDTPVLPECQLHRPGAQPDLAGKLIDAQRQVQVLGHPAFQRHQPSQAWVYGRPLLPAGCRLLKAIEQQLAQTAFRMGEELGSPQKAGGVFEIAGRLQA